VVSVNAQALLGRYAAEAPASVVESVVRAFGASQDSGRAAFLARSIAALVGLAAAMDERQLGSAAGAGSDYETLLLALESPQALVALDKGVVLGTARLRGLHQRQELLARAGGLLSAEQVANSLGISRQAVNKRRQAGHLIGISLGRRGYAYPARQFGPEGVLAGLQQVLEDLEPHDSWMKLAFLLNGTTLLGGQSPLEALSQGKLAEARQAARAYAQ
jgi:biotin operon repressor